MLRVRADKAIKSNATWKCCARRHHRLPQKSAVQSVRAWQLSKHAKHTRGLTRSKTSITTHACDANTTPWVPPRTAATVGPLSSRNASRVQCRRVPFLPRDPRVRVADSCESAAGFAAACCCHHHRCFPVFLLFGRSTHCSHVSSLMLTVLKGCSFQLTLPIPL